MSQLTVRITLVDNGLEFLVRISATISAHELQWEAGDKLKW